MKKILATIAAAIAALVMSAGVASAHGLSAGQADSGGKIYPVGY